MALKEENETLFANLVDFENETIYPAALHFEKGKIVEIKKSQRKYAHFLIPGFVDAHIHIESSMLPPSEFARLAVIHGTVATVSDPHEIGNVLGVEGVEYMLENAQSVPLKFYFGAPSCVPATSFETSGAHIGPDEIRYLLMKKEIKYLSEVMNFPGVIHKDPPIMKKLAIAKELNKKIDGHAPGLSGDNLKCYIASGIETDHECTSLEEAREKRKLGMKILIREGSAARNFEALFPLLLEDPDHCMLCTDDSHPDSLSKGHINLLVKRAVEKGLDPIKALRVSSLNAIEHYGLDVGMLRLNDSADMVLVEDLHNFRVLSTYIEGRCVSKGDKVLFPRTKEVKLINRFHASLKKETDFQIKAKKCKLKVIQAIDGELLTKKMEISIPRSGGFVHSQPELDILKIAVVNRYTDSKPSVAFIKNFGLKQGAIASSVAHDSHNIIAVGVKDEELCQAVNCIIALRGGIALVNQEIEMCLPLPIAGLMSDQDASSVAKQYEKMNEVAKKMSPTLAAPFMTLSFMALLVIPQLKISDLGLFDYTSFGLTDLFEPD